MPAERSTIRPGKPAAHRASATVPAEPRAKSVPTKSGAQAASHRPEPRTSARAAHPHQPHASARTVHLRELHASAFAMSPPDPRVSSRAASRQQDNSDSLEQALLTGSAYQRPQLRLLVASQRNAADCYRFARLLGYVSTAFLMACANASLVGILSGARLSRPPCLSLRGSPTGVASFPSQRAPAFQPWTPRQARPRAPPSQVAVVC